jgi:hypothetical protein
MNILMFIQKGKCDCKHLLDKKQNMASVLYRQLHY